MFPHPGRGVAEWTPLTRTILTARGVPSCGRTDVVRVLLEAGTDVNKGVRGYTALMEARGHGTDDIAHFSKRGSTG